MKGLLLSKDNPKNLKELYPTMGTLTIYFYTLSYEELKATLQRFEFFEFYEDCIIIDSIIREKIKYIARQ
jgi:hypothetical protein